jgi:hypothetical protein
MDPFFEDKNKESDGEDEAQSMPKSVYPFEEKDKASDSEQESESIPK